MANKLEEKKQYQHLLLKERAANEQHRLNYEKLKAITIRYKLDQDSCSSSGHTTDKKTGSQILPIEYMASLSHSNDYGGKISPATPYKASKNLQRLRRVPVVYKEPDESQKKLLFNLERERLIVGEPKQNEEETRLAGELWKAQYLSILEEYKKYKAFSEAALKTQTARAIEETQKEYEQTLNFMQNENSSNDARCAELSRAHRVIAAERDRLRDELADTRLQLDTKNDDYNSLLKKTDGGSCLDADGKCGKESHKYIEFELSKCKQELEHCQREVKTLRIKNKVLGENMRRLKDSNEEEAQEMKGLLVCVYNNCISEKTSLQKKYQEVSTILNSQQAYVEEIDSYVKSRENENNLIVDEVCQNLKKVILDGKEALEVIEGKLRSTVSEREQLVDDLGKAVRYLEKTKDEIESHHRFTNNFVSKLYRIIGIPYPGSVSPDCPIYSDNTKDVVFNAQISQRRKEEENLEKAMELIISWKTDQTAKRKLLETQVSELEARLKSEGGKVAPGSEVPKMSYKFYPKRNVKPTKRLIVSSRPNVIRNPKGKIVENQVYFSDKITTEVDKTDSVTFNPTVDQILKKHVDFGKLLNTVKAPIDDNCNK